MSARMISSRNNQATDGEGEMLVGERLKKCKNSFQRFIRKPARSFLFLFIGIALILTKFRQNPSKEPALQGLVTQSDRESLPQVGIGIEATRPSYQSHCTKFQSAPSLLEAVLNESEYNGTAVLTVAHMDGIASGHFPTTRFTPHVEQIVQLINLTQMARDCKWKFTVVVPKPYSRPTKIICQGKGRSRMVPWWCVILERLFLEPALQTGTSSLLQNYLGPNVDPILPTNVSFAISSDDFLKVDSEQSMQYTCLANSAPHNGIFSITNVLELQRMADRTTYPILDWQTRCALPIWRGSAWITSGKLQPNVDVSILDQALSKCIRCRAVTFSKDHGDLLDARIGDDRNGFMNTAWNKQYEHLWSLNVTFGLDALLPVHHIPPEEYYTQYQTALVLCGWGAAFRTTTHFSTATAVILQECPQQEWYRSLITTDPAAFVPWEHYIPLDAELAKLQVTLTWVREHPTQVHSIALAGRRFYEDYLSFQRNYEHFYELVYRLSLKRLHQQKNHRTHPRTPPL